MARAESFAKQISLIVVVFSPVVKQYRSVRTIEWSVILPDSPMIGHIQTLQEMVSATTINLLLKVQVSHDYNRCIKIPFYDLIYCSEMVSY